MKAFVGFLFILPLTACGKLSSLGVEGTATTLAEGRSAEALDESRGLVVIGKARFTVITQTLIRMEYSESGVFLDLPTYFAASREARYTEADISVAGQTLTIDTGSLRLSYVNDGRPFSSANLSAEIRSAEGSKTFYPTAANSENLGGTTRTLDGWNGANRLDDGILSRSGHYVLDDSQGHVLENGWIRERRSPETDLYLFGYGHDYRAALASLTAISGEVPLPRKYLFGAWYSRYWPYSSEDYKNLVREYDHHGFPLDVMVLDMDWHRGSWTGWSWNKNLIPDPAGLMDQLHAQGLHTTLNVHPADGVGPHEDSYSDFMNALGRNPSTAETLPFDAANQSYMNALFDKVHGPLDEVGADFYWLDWQQWEFTSSLPRLRNLPWLNELYFRHTGKHGLRGVSFSRWGGFGDHRHPIHFSGDASTTFEMLAFEVPFTSTSSNSGLFFWSHDIGGHQGARDDESYARWSQFGALSAALRSHSTRDPNLDRRPWTYADWAYASMKKSFELRSRLFPYIYSSVWQSSRESVPLLRPMYLDNPSDDAAYRQPQQYWFGDNLLVAPIVERGAGARRVGRQAVWFPRGKFYDLSSGESYEGPGEHLVARTIDEIPLFARAGVPIAMQPFTRRMATDPISELVLRCFPGEDGQSSSSDLHEDDGVSMAYKEGRFATTRLTCSREGDEFTVQIDPTEGSFEGQQAARSYLIEIPATMKAEAASVDGLATEAVYDNQEAVNRVRVSARSIGQSTQVRIKAATMPSSELRKRAFAKRFDLNANQGSLEALATQAWSRANGNAEKLAVLAAAGAGVLAKNENLYGYPNSPTLVAYNPDGINAASNVSLTWDSVMRRQEGWVTFAGETIRLTELDFDFSKRGTNFAARATASFSSLEFGETTGIADAKVGGYPKNRVEEWSTAGEKSGAWIRLDFPQFQTVSEVVLFDRINPNDQILSGELLFDDGSTVPVGSIPNSPADGALILRFSPKWTRSVTFRVKSVSATTENVGLAEMAVYGP